jgi:hypothetical protein
MGRECGKAALSSHTALKPKPIVISTERRNLKKQVTPVIFLYDFVILA